jgi:hypothetical protein
MDLPELGKSVEDMTELRIAKNRNSRRILKRTKKKKKTYTRKKW